MGSELKLRLILEQPPAGVDFGLQSGKGAGYTTIQTQRSGDKDLRFEFTVEVQPRAAGMEPDFRGPLVQGPAKARFIYVDIGTYAGQEDSCWSRRLKVPLSGITWKMIDAGAAGILEARVPGTGRDGGPNCASVREFEGWKVADRK